MKSLCCGLTAILLLALSLATGCSKKIAVDTAPLDYSFQEADQATKTTVDEAVVAIDKADYTTALDKLKKVSADPKLTPDQKTAVNGVVAELEKR